MLNVVIIFFGLLATAIYMTHLIIRPKQLRQESPNSNNEPVFLLSADANEYSVTFDKCEFRDRSFSAEVEVDNSDYKVAARIIH